MAVAHGDTFWVPSDDDNSVEHLYIVISDPVKDADNVVMVPLTTLESWKDDSCVLHAGEHPNITHDSCIDYRRSQIVPARQIEQSLSEGRIRARQPASPTLLSRILLGASETRQLSGVADGILARQGLIE